MLANLNNRSESSSRQRYHRLPELVLLGLIAGTVTALLITLFRLLLDLPAQVLIWLDSEGGLSGLPAHWRFVLPLIGALIIWLIWRVQSPDNRRVGITHIHERISHHHGDLPVRNLVNQLFGCVLALTTGHPVGREGPAVHLGAAISSWTGQRLGLPYSMQRLLVGCGSAAAIAALFNLPLAGILFAMEVILLEYSLIGFTAVIIAAVSADTLTQWLLGAPAPLSIATDQLALHIELPLLILLSLVIALGGWLFQQIQVSVAAQRKLSLSLRFLSAGLLIASLTLIFPELMRPIHEVTYEVIGGQLVTSDLIRFTLLYLCVTPLILGLGIPGGVIGPALALGALLGALVSIAFNQFGAQTELSVYALIGMASMMSAIIHAPLAALVAVFELSSDTHTLTAAMLVIVMSDLVMRAVFAKPSIFERLLQAQGLSLNTQVYRRVMMSTNVQEVADPSIRLIDPSWDETQCRLLAAQSNWLVRANDQQFSVLRGGREEDSEIATGIPAWEESEALADAHWTHLPQVSHRASLLQVLDQMDQTGQTVLLVIRKNQPVGVVTEQAIQRFYRERAE